ncbi:uncharacterized protein [Rutidosis leptorrhynchoides]|uniref:uncharacterized protein n=1 Tax=Rutidosis leptorrhynchoides TaxID=125765 RepID=UPI003A98CF0D
MKGLILLHFKKQSVAILTIVGFMHCGGNNEFGFIQKEAIRSSGNWHGSGHESIVVNVYGPHNDASKRLMWESLDDLLCKFDSAWVVCGDFNEVREKADRLNCVFHHGRAKRFNEFITKNNLIEIAINGRKFTRISDDGSKFSKIDRFLVSDKFLSLWDDLSIIALERRESDHFPLLLREKIIDFGPKPFKVFDKWFSRIGVDVIIQEAWNNSVGGTRKDCIFQDRLKNVKHALKSWSKKEFGSLDIEINNLKNKASVLEKKVEEGCISEVERVDWLEARRCWLEKEKCKSNMLKQKARIRWILEGEENSKFFHSTIRRKHNKCSIRGLYINGAWNENPIDVKEAVFVHFQQVFNGTECRKPHLLNWAEATRLVGLIRQIL